ncbi:MAG TPA: ice-binding family protein [Xanthomonadaceae bacterium]|nr:ice-binding family protein [Xanthomonadaceae bacterium]
MLAPLVALAQSDNAQSEPQPGSYPLWSQQYDASYFTVLSAAAGTRGAVTCTDSTMMGNVGSSGARAAVVQTRCSVSGQVVAPVTPTVLAQFNSKFDAIGDRKCEKALTGTLAGMILKPGVYCFPAAASVTGTLTLDGPAFGVWVIKVNGNLTGKSFSMVMADKGKPCNVYLESSGATTMTTSNAKGNIYSGEAITLTGGSFVGRAFAKKAITMTDIAATGCVQ